MTQKFDETKSALQLQKEFCNKNNLPCLAPETGICYRCHKNIYGGERPVTKEKASSTLITGCQYCHASYCD